MFNYFVRNCIWMVCIGAVTCLHAEDQRTDPETRLELLDAIERTVQYTRDFSEYHVEVSAVSFHSNGDHEPKSNWFDEYVEHKGEDDLRFVVGTRGTGYLNVAQANVQTNLRSSTIRMQGGRYHAVFYEPKSHRFDREIRFYDTFPQSVRALWFEYMTIVSGNMSMNSQQGKDKLSEIIDDILSDQSKLLVDEISPDRTDKKLKRFLVVKQGPESFNCLEFICDPEKDMRVVSTRRALSKRGAKDPYSKKSYELPFYSIKTDWVSVGETWVPSAIVRHSNGLTVSGENLDIVATSRAIAKLSIKFSSVRKESPENEDSDDEPANEPRQEAAEKKWTPEQIEELARKQIDSVRRRIE